MKRAKKQAALPRGIAAPELPKPPPQQALMLVEATPPAAAELLTAAEVVDTWEGQAWNPGGPCWREWRRVTAPADRLTGAVLEELAAALIVGWLGARLLPRLLDHPPRCWCGGH